MSKVSAAAATRKKNWRQEFLRVLADSANVRMACEQAGIDRSTAYRARQADEDFALAWADAIDEAIDQLEQEARRRAYEGIDKPVHYQGLRVDTVREYSDVLLIFLLKAHRPAMYRDRYSVEHTGKDGGPITLLDLEKLVGDKDEEHAGNEA